MSEAPPPPPPAPPALAQTFPPDAPAAAEGLPHLPVGLPAALPVGLTAEQLAALSPVAVSPEALAAEIDPQQLAALQALQMAQLSSLGLTTGLGSAQVLHPGYAAAAQAAQANAIALYYQALQGLYGAGESALGLGADLLGSEKISPKPGDWACPGCGFHNFARNTTCRSCGGEKPPESELVMPQLLPDGRQMRPGDWLCPMCGTHNFAKNQECYKCNTPRPADVLAMSQARTPAVVAREGDWNCKACGDLQFARNAACRRCGSVKPEDAGLTPAVSTPMARNPGSDLRPGDWMCPKCNDHVFARNDNCRRCGQSRPTGADLAAMAAAGTLPPVNSATSLAPRQSDMKPGDWKCPQCKDLVFARNSSCRRCGATRPADRSRSPKRR